ncbi:MAG: hypothetical protein QM679_01995 [Patulibacter sp.]
MNYVLDAGALIAIDRRDRRMFGFVAAQMVAGSTFSTHGGVVAQAWRGGGRQVMLRRALGAIEVVALSRGLGQQAGALLAASGTSDVVDAALVCMARDGETIITSDPHDVAYLIDMAGVDVTIRHV